LLLGSQTHGTPLVHPGGCPCPFVHKLVAHHLKFLVGAFAQLRGDWGVFMVNGGVFMVIGGGFMAIAGSIPERGA
jgi:hypothetical protein